jgi:hypothetical protein
LETCGRLAAGLAKAVINRLQDAILPHMKSAAARNG